MTENLPTTNVKLEEILECTICLDVPASPIHNCTNGHVVCGICQDKVKNCGLCQGVLAVCPFAERISKQVNPYALKCCILYLNLFIFRWS